MIWLLTYALLVVGLAIAVYRTPPNEEWDRIDQELD